MKFTHEDIMPAKEPITGKKLSEIYGIGDYIGQNRVFFACSSDVAKSIFLSNTNVIVICISLPHAEICNNSTQVHEFFLRYPVIF
jgi:hypothetical protein